MATRPIFVPDDNNISYIKEIPIEFEWHAGFAITQSQKSIKSLHESAKLLGFYPILEISTKSIDRLGVELSAFNLFLYQNGKPLTVECAFQGSKVFEKGGPYQDLYFRSSIEAKKDTRIKESGELIGFKFFDKQFPIFPKTVFYDWLYFSALFDHPEYINQLFEYAGFSDIAFNPERSINCQARSAALYVSLINRKIDKNTIIDPEYLPQLFDEINCNKQRLITQMDLPFNI